MKETNIDFNNFKCEDFCTDDCPYIDLCKDGCPLENGMSLDDLPEDFPKECMELIQKKLEENNNNLGGCSCG